MKEYYRLRAKFMNVEVNKQQKNFQRTVSRLTKHSKVDAQSFMPHMISLNFKNSAFNISEKLKDLENSKKNLKQENEALDAILETDEKFEQTMTNQKSKFFSLNAA